MRLIKHALKLAQLLALTATFATGVSAQTAIHVYGPGGPAPAMQEAAKVFGAANNVVVNVAAGPTAQWLDKAKQDADVVFSGAENMMSDLAKAMPAHSILQTHNRSTCDPWRSWSGREIPNAFAAFAICSSLA